MYKNTEHTVTIENIASGGEGIAKIDGYTVFVPFSVKGDVVRILIVKENKNYGFGKILEVIKPSDERCIPLCELFGKCGGCNLQNMTSSAQAEFKRQKVQDAMQRIGGFTDLTVCETVSGDYMFNYRNKAQFPVSADVNGNLVYGFYAPRSHRVLPLKSCALQNDTINAIAAFTAKWASENNVLPYDESTHKGLLRHICVRCGKTEATVVLVTTKPIKNSEKLAQLLHENFPIITGVVENINDKKTNTIYGDKDRIIFGVPYIYDTIGDVKYKIHYKSFYQVNPYTTEKLYNRVLELASPDKNTTVFDLYCGGGTISLFLAKHAKKVIGIEYVKEAVDNARENARLNNTENAFFYCGKAEEEAPKLIKNGETADVVVLDPPRKGCDEVLLDAIGKMKPEKIVYVSCDCATMARDAKILTKYGYSPVITEAFDQFPQTCHVESVALLTLSTAI